MKAPTAKDTPGTDVIRRIWTWGYRPWILGGSVNYVLACDVNCSGPHNLGGGYKGYAATAPSGKVFIAEATTGAIIGNGVTENRALKTVRQDIKTGDKKVMRDQVTSAAKHAKKAEVKDTKFFWNALECDSPNTKEAQST